MLGLSWVNTYGGGAPTSLALDVSGPITASMPLGLTETFSFPSVPPGTYTFSVRAINAAGSSGASNPVTLTFPASCSGAPQAPINFVTSVSGNLIALTWQPAATGPASMSYLVNVTGAFVGDVSTTARSLSGRVGPGTYNVRVRAVNPCGTSSATAMQTVIIP
jgi:large repetitive protein